MSNSCDAIGNISEIFSFLLTRESYISPERTSGAMNSGVPITVCAVDKAPPIWADTPKSAVEIVFKTEREKIHSNGDESSLLSIHSVSKLIHER